MAIGADDHGEPSTRKAVPAAASPPLLPSGAAKPDAPAAARSPCLKLKPVTKGKKDPFLMVNVEPYGGGLWHTWFDRDLSLAGRVLLRAPDGSLKHRLVRPQSHAAMPTRVPVVSDLRTMLHSAVITDAAPRWERLRARYSIIAAEQGTSVVGATPSAGYYLCESIMRPSVEVHVLTQSSFCRLVQVKIERPILRIPMLAIHLSRDIYTEGFKPNKQTHLVPILATALRVRLTRP